MDWTLIVWRLLCLLTCMSAFVSITAWDVLPPIWQGLVIVPGLLVTLLLAGEWAHASQRSRRVSGRR